MCSQARSSSPTRRERFRCRSCSSASPWRCWFLSRPTRPAHPARTAHPAPKMLYLTIIGGAFITWLILDVLFTPHIPYHIEAEIAACSDHFLHVLESTCQTHLDEGNHVEILTDGDMFYPTMLEAIRNARETINMECYIFKKGDIGDAFIDALCDRAKAGVRVTIVMDAIGSFGAFRTSKKTLEAAAGRAAADHTLPWYRLNPFDDHTHTR